jgi:pimeloyl-ACP methyl ester carboxylesterase
MKNTIGRRTAATWLAAGAALPLLPAHAQAPAPVGVLLLHGKNPGGPASPGYTGLMSAFGREGWPALLPDMPWSRNRYLAGHWDQAMAEVDTHVQALRTKGAQKIVIAGHSMGCPAAMGYAARGGDVQALVLLAPGHAPRHYQGMRNTSVKDSVAQAKRLVADGKGDVQERFRDINQGRDINVVTSAKNYLSFFDPDSEAEMGVSAPRVPATLPVLLAVGDKDPLFTTIRAYAYDRLPANPRSRYLEVGGGHLETPNEALQPVVQWIKEATAA